MKFHMNTITDVSRQYEHYDGNWETETSILLSISV